MCLVTNFFLVIIFLLVIFWLAGGTKENFTIAKRDDLLCPPLIRKSLEDKLLPNSVIFVIQGYNYADTPKIYRDGKKIVPLQYEWDAEATAYYFTVSAPQGLCNSEWVLETSDFVKPVIVEGRSGGQLTVGLLRRREGFNRWSISC